MIVHAGEHGEEGDTALEVSLNGVELALLIALDMVNSWAFQKNDPREKLTEAQRRTIRRVSSHLYEVRKKLLIAAGVFIPPVIRVPSPEYVRKRATIQATVLLTREEIGTCLAVLRFCHEELSEDTEDPEGAKNWEILCNISSTSLWFFNLELADLLELVSKLERILRGDLELPSQPQEQSSGSCDWPPGEAVLLDVSGVELALLKGSLSFLDDWAFRSAVAQAMAAQAERDMASSIYSYLVREEQSLLRFAGALVPAAVAVTPEHIAMRAVFRSQHWLMREHLRVCIAALRVCEEEFSEHWVDFCQIAPSGLHRFNPAQGELPRLATKLEQLLNV